MATSFNCPHCGKPLLIVKAAQDPGADPGDEGLNPAREVIRDFRDHGVDLLPGGREETRPGFSEPAGARAVETQARCPSRGRGGTARGGSEGGRRVCDEHHTRPEAAVLAQPRRGPLAARGDRVGGPGPDRDRAALAGVVGGGQGRRRPGPGAGPGDDRPQAGEGGPHAPALDRGDDGGRGVPELVAAIGAEMAVRAAEEEGRSRPATRTRQPALSAVGGRDAT